jgi:hypothetical protein
MKAAIHGHDHYHRCALWPLALTVTMPAKQFNLHEELSSSDHKRPIPVFWLRMAAMFHVDPGCAGERYWQVVSCHLLLRAVSISTYASHHPLGHEN